MRANADAMTDPVGYEISAPGVARITLNRPERLNALTLDAATALLGALARAAAPDVRVVVLTGAGRGFCSGTDLRANFSPGGVSPEQSLRTSRNPIVLAMRALPKPVVCAVNGVAAGIGVSIALAGDVVVARASATFNLAFARVGLVPDGGATWMLERTVGRMRAMRMAMLAESIDAIAAAELGLISLAVPDDAFADEVDAVVTRLAHGPTRAFAAMKQAFDAAPGQSLASQLELEARLQGEVAATGDFAEGLAAFAEGREPAFTGC